MAYGPPAAIARSAGLQKPALANLGHIGKKLLRSETLPSISQHGQATAVQRLRQLDLL
jgi:hypothetical protein